MGVEFLKLLLALGTGLLSTAIAFFANWVPSGDHNTVNFVVMTAVIGLIKRGLDYLASKTAKPANPTATTYPRA